MRDVVEEMQRDLQAQMEKNLADACCREQEAREAADKVASELEQLTKQLN